MKGIAFRKTAQDNTVIRLHYSADINKDPDTESGLKWRDMKAKKYIDGVNSLEWRREMEIDFKAGVGELVFPTFDAAIDPVEVGFDKTLYGGLDWGTRNPTSFHVYSVDSKTQVFNSIWEYYGTGLTVFGLAEVIRKCPYYSRLEWIVADLNMWDKNQNTTQGLTSVAEMMQDDTLMSKSGIVDKLRPTDHRSDVAGINKFKMLFEQKQFSIFKTCPQQISEFTNLKYPERVETRNETEKILDKDNHSWDEAKYFILSHPYGRVTEPKPKYGTYGYYNKCGDLAAAVSEETGREYQDCLNDIYGSW